MSSVLTPGKVYKQFIFLQLFKTNSSDFFLSFPQPCQEKKKKETKKNERVLNLLFDGTKLGTENKDIWLYPEVPLYFLNT